MQKRDFTGKKFKKKLLFCDRVYRSGQGVPVSLATSHLFFLKQDAKSDGESLRNNRGGEEVQCEMHSLPQALGPDLSLTVTAAGVP